MIIKVILLFLYCSLNSLINYNNILSIIISFLIIFILGIMFIKNKLDLKNKKNILISIVISIVLTILTSSNFITEYNSEKITIENTSSKYILIDNIYLNNKKEKLNGYYYSKYDLINNANISNEYKDQNKNTSDYKMTLIPNSKYIINIKNQKNVLIEFQKQKYFYKVKINNKEVKVSNFNYKKVIKKAQKLGNYNYKYSYNNVKKTNISIKQILILIILLIVYFIFTNISLQNNKIKRSLLFLLLIELNPIGKIDLSTKLFLIIIFFLIYKIDKDKEKNLLKKEKILFIVSSIYIGFSFLGKYLIESFCLNNILNYLILTYFIYNILPLFIQIIDKIKQKIRIKKDTSKLKYHRIIVFFICVFILLLYKIIFSPYVFLTDSYMQCTEVTSGLLTNWHPYLHTLLLKLFYCMFDNFDSFIYFRIIIYSLIINTILFYFNKKGLKLVYIYFIAIIFTILPTVALPMISLLKDTDFTISIVLLTFYMYLLFCDNEYYRKNKLNYIYMLLSLIGVGFFRHNGFFAAIIIALIIFITSIKNKEKFLLLMSITFIICSIIINGPLYKMLKIKNGPRNIDISTMIHGLDYVLVENKLDKNTYKYLTKKVYQLRLCYDKYSIDILLHYNSNKTSEKLRELKINKKDITELYIKQLFKTPILLIKDRLYGTDLVWNVVEDDKINITKLQITHDEFDTNYAKYIDLNNKTNKSIEKILTFISNNDLLNILFFRSGIYIDILIVLINYNLLKKRRKMVICILPIFTYLLTLLVAMQFQTVRYIWMIAPITFVYLLITIFNKKEGKI